MTEFCFLRRTPQVTFTTSQNGIEQTNLLCSLSLRVCLDGGECFGGLSLNKLKKYNITDDHKIFQ